MTDNYAGGTITQARLSRTTFCLAAALAWALPGCATSQPQIFGGRLSHGDCSVVGGRIECRRCDAGWSGIRCNVCRNPSRCGSRPAEVHNGVVTRYFPPSRPNPAWRDGVFAGTFEHRTIQQVAPVDSAYERAEDRRRGIENRYGVKRRVMRPLAGDPGHPQTDGGRVWTRGYRSPGARSLGVVLTGVSLPAGAELWLYSERATHGPVTPGDLPRGLYSTPPLWGDLIYLELRQAPGSGGPPAIDELALIHEYGGAAGPVDCAVDVACFPGAENQANGVALILLHGGLDSFWCSGSLLNTAAGGPIFLTAEHCLWEDHSEYFDYLLDPEQANPSGQADFSSSTFVFHYRNLSCNPPAQDVSNDIWNALSFVGADIELHDHETDIGLLRLDQSPNPDCVSYLGFDATAPGAMPDYTVGISHPAGLLAEIHVDWDPPTVVDYIDEEPEIEESFVEDDTFYRQVLGAGDPGWPQGGSSGSPLFDPTGRVVGQLSGHWPNTSVVCSSSVGWMSGRLSRSASIVPELGGILGASGLDAAGDTATSAVPLSESKVGPCVNNSYWYTINHRVADGFNVQFELDGDSATIVESAPDGRGVRILFSDDQPIDLRITVTNTCYEDERTLRIEPTFCM